MKKFIVLFLASFLLFSCNPNSTDSIKNSSTTASTSDQRTTAYNRLKTALSLNETSNSSTNTNLVFSESDSSVDINWEFVIKMRDEGSSQNNQKQSTDILTKYDATKKLVYVYSKDNINTDGDYDTELWISDDETISRGKDKGSTVVSKEKNPYSPNTFVSGVSEMPVLALIEKAKDSSVSANSDNCFVIYLYPSDSSSVSANVVANTNSFSNSYSPIDSSTYTLATAKSDSTSAEFYMVFTLAYSDSYLKSIKGEKFVKGTSEGNTTYSKDSYSTELVFKSYGKDVSIETTPTPTNN